MRRRTIADELGFSERDLVEMSDGEISLLKSHYVKERRYDKAAIIREFEKHCIRVTDILKTNNIK